MTVEKCQAIMMANSAYEFFGLLLFFFIRVSDRKSLIQRKSNACLSGLRIPLLRRNGCECSHANGQQCQLQFGMSRYRIPFMFLPIQSIHQSIIDHNHPGVGGGGIYAFIIHQVHSSGEIDQQLLYTL